MTTVRVHKAQPIGARVVSSLTIVADETLPEAPTLDAARLQYQLEARWLADALYQCLPGGTMDELLVEMLRQKASLFRVAYVEPSALETPA